MTGNEFIQYALIPLVAATLGAIIGAVLAFRYQRKIEIQRDKRGLMQMLMAHRTIGAVELDWVKALNMVDIVFHNNKEIKRLLRSYMHHTDTARFANGHHQEVLVQLLVEIGKECGYTEITESDIRDGYNPISLQHIYAATLERLSHEVSVSDTPPITRPLNNEKAEEK
jgi:hypothetical protein